MSSESLPLYQRYAHLYAYDTQSKNHLLKSGVLYKKRYAENPQRFVESATMFSENPRIPEPPPDPSKKVIRIEHVEQKVKQTQIGKPNPKPGPSEKELEEKQKQKDEMIIRSQIQSLIKEELRDNPNQYKNKTANDLSQMFRQMLIDKLTSANINVKESKSMKQLKDARVRPMAKKWNFKVEDDYVEEEYDDVSDPDAGYQNDDENEYDNIYKNIDYH